MKNKIIYLLLFAFVFSIIACNSKDTKNPIEYINSFGPVWMIFDNYINSNDIIINKYTDNSKSFLDFNYFDGHEKVIYLYWNGDKAKVLDPYSENYGKEQLWYGFYLEFENTRDLIEAGYTHIEFFLKGALNGNNILEVTGFSADECIELNENSVDKNDYKKYNIEIPTNKLQNVKKIIGFALKNKSGIFLDLPSGEAKVFIDKIQLVKKTN
ncbi:MAG: hypothetical protein LBF97_08355 [Elusimicrobiota bacterium]|jgi:hypothetical protein|nr:hypothetical protein [Elusimicrobiota bacterium]